MFKTSPQCDLRTCPGQTVIKNTVWSFGTENSSRTGFESWLCSKLPNIWLQIRLGSQISGQATDMLKTAFWSSEIFYGLYFFTCYIEHHKNS